MFFHEDKNNQIIPPKKPVYPPMFFLAALGMMYLLNRSFPGFYFFHSKTAISVGCLMMLFGIALIFWGWKTIKDAGTTIKPYEESSALVMTGPFSYTRNPIYLGMVITLFGVFCLMGSSTPLIMVFIFGGLIEDKFIMMEEKMLEEKFGETYLNYKASVSRWFPLLTEFAWEKTAKQKDKNKK